LLSPRGERRSVGIPAGFFDCTAGGPPVGSGAGGDPAAGAIHKNLCVRTPCDKITLTSDGAAHKQFQLGGVNVPGMRRATYRVRLAGLSAFFLALMVLAAARPVAAQTGKPLNEGDVIELLEGGVPSARVAEIVNERGIAFDFTAESEQRIRNAGGADDLVSALRRAARRRAESEQPRTGGLRFQTTPGEAQVYLNDEPKGITSPEGDIRLPGLKPGTYSVRVSVLGYQSWEKTITVAAGEVQTVYVTLVPKPPENPVKDNPPPVQETPPVTSPSTGIPVPGVKVSPLQFFEGTHDKTPDKSERVYRFSFDRRSTRSIYWELDLSYPKPNQRIEFKVDAYWYRPDGTEMGRQTLDGYVQPDWTSSSHSRGWGWADTGHWTSGTYRVDLYVGNTRVASGTFQIN
jgi:hypothetical protein